VRKRLHRKAPLTRSSAGFRIKGGEIFPKAIGEEPISVQEEEITKGGGATPSTVNEKERARRKRG